MILEEFLMGNKEDGNKEKNLSNQIKILQPNAGGIDIGSEEHYVCVPEGREPQCVRKFGSYTADLQKMADWLKKCGVNSVVMESTGVYWIPVFQILESQGFEVKLVNARHVKNVPGRKTDVQDCQWLQKLHTFGLLSGSFRPDNEICVLRSYIRQRQTLIQQGCQHIQRMQKAYEQMNVHLHKVISDITGLTGTKITTAILKGERDSKKLAQFRDPRVKKSEEEMAEALNGDFRKEHLFSLKQEFDLHTLIKEKITECDIEIEKLLSTFDSKIDPNKQPLEDKKNPKKSKNESNFNLREHFYRICGTDLTRIDGLDVNSIQTIISETGLTMDKWSTEKHFSSWLGLCPNNEITGGKIQKRKSKKVINRAATAFRIGAQTLLRSQTALGAYYRRMRQRLGAPKAITATARKLACLFYRLLKFGQTYVDKGMDYYEKKYKDRVLKNIQKTAKNLGFALVPIEAKTA